MDTRRRSTLRAAAALCAHAGLASAATLSLAGCATRPPAPPPPPPRPFDTVLLLPVAPPERKDSSGFGGDRGRPAPVVPPTAFTGPGGGNISPGAGVAALGVAILLSAALSARQEAQRKDEQAIREAVAAIDLDVATGLDERIADALHRRGLHVRRIVDPEQVAALRAGRREGTAAAADAGAAVVDVNINGAGYYASSRAGGYSPTIDVWAVLRGPVGDAAAEDELSYYADWRDGGKESRWITSPAALTFATTDAIKEQAAAVRQGLSEMLDRMAEMVADDVQRRAQGQPALP